MCSEQTQVFRIVSLLARSPISRAVTENHTRSRNGYGTPELPKKKHFGAVWPLCEAKQWIVQVLTFFCSDHERLRTSNFFFMHEKTSEKGGKMNRIILGVLIFFVTCALAQAQTSTPIEFSDNFESYEIGANPTVVYDFGGLRGESRMIHFPLTGFRSHSWMRAIVTRS